MTQHFYNRVNSIRGAGGWLNVPVIYRISGEPYVPALETAVTRTLERHAALRTVVTKDGDELVQLVYPVKPFTIKPVDISSDGQDIESLIERLIIAEISEDVDESDHLPFNLRLFRLGPDDYLLILNINHMITDAWSTSIAWRDITTYYNRELGGRDAEPEPVEWQYTDFTDWEKRHLRGELSERHRAFWRTELAGMKAFDLKPPPERRYGQRVLANNLWFSLGIDELDELKRLGKRYRTSLFVTLLSVFYAVLYEETGQLDIPICSVFANRLQAEVRETVGPFANLSALRLRLPEAPSFDAVLTATRSAVFTALEHQEFPYSRARLEAPRGERPENTTFHMLIVPDSIETIPFRGLTMTPLRFTEGPSYHFNMEVAIRPSETGVDGLIRYASDQYDRGYVERLARSYATMARRVIAEPAQTLLVRTLAEPSATTS